MRPSDFQDAAVWRDESRPTLDVTVDMAEELGSEVNLIFALDAKPIESAVEAQAADDSGDGAFVPLAPTDATVCTACVAKERAFAMQDRRDAVIEKTGGAVYRSSRRWLLIPQNGGAE